MDERNGALSAVNELFSQARGRPLTVAERLRIDELLEDAERADHRLQSLAGHEGRMERRSM